MNQKGISHTIRPGNMVEKVLKNGEKRIVHNISLGRFWMLKDLRETENKPIISNNAIISVQSAEMLPLLKGLKSLNGAVVDLPKCLIKTDGTSENSCTLIALSFKDFGYKMLPRWIVPFEEALKKSGRASVVHINVTEGYFLQLLSGLFTASVKKNTPVDRHDSTFLYFGGASSVDNFRDTLRLHNTLCGYVLLVDGQGRLRWIGSGSPNEEELDLLIQCGHELVSSDDGTSTRGETAGSRSDNNRQTKRARVGRKVKRLTRSSR